MKRFGYVEILGQGTADPARLGGKGASLARLVALGYRVPPGMVVTIHALAETIERMGLARAVEAVREALRTGSGDLLGPGAVVREGLLAGRIHREVLEPILDLGRDLRPFEDAPAGVIARSSATVEDSAAFSFAGIFESIPVPDEGDLEPAIRQVWASAFTPRALSYASESGLAAVPAMAVVVQGFLDATRSGVMFTEFTAPDGASRILVEHVEGGCEKLVRGEITPERLWLEGPDRVPDEVGGLLAGVHVRELARLAEDLQDMFGTPQDVEWVIYDQVVHVVQSRPITASSSRRPGVVHAVVDGLDPVLTGVPASPGVGAGAVQLVFNIDQALALERGRVLVTPMTNPDMVVAMRNSAGIVTDVGGMICHAAIVSRELGLPCVVGTESATQTLAAGQAVTVDGSRGLVYLGIHAVAGSDAASIRPARWSDVWGGWMAAIPGPDALPRVSSVGALQSLPPGIERVELIPDVEVRADRHGLWNDLEGMPRSDREAAFEDYVRRVSASLPGGSCSVELTTIGSLSSEDLGAALSRLGDPRLDLSVSPQARGVPLTASLVDTTLPPPPVAGIDQALTAALDTVKFFGHRPGSTMAHMPDVASRRTWWDLLPEYGRFHRENRTEDQPGRFEWLEVRPELVISALLKSLVQPGFEMVPRVLGFRDLPPMHVKWIRCRYHFRADTFARVWEAIVRSTYDEEWMAGLMRRVRASYRYLEEVLRLFPQTDRDLAEIPAEHITALLSAIEFFSLCWFIQAQGDDISYPFVQETVAANLASIVDPPAGVAWPGVADLIAPTTPVMSGAYMADVGHLREALLAAGLVSVVEAEAALARGEHEDLASALDAHLRKWHWMRDRDLLFEPWDTPGRVIETALKTEPHTATSYGENLDRNLFALSFHVDLAQRIGRAAALNHHARFLHDLNVERENHHLLWLKFSYPLRRVLLEVERRLIEAGGLAPGDVFFLQAPELIEGAGRLPEPLSEEVVAKVKNRRIGYLVEARLAREGVEPPVEEDDYY